MSLTHKQATLLRFIARYHADSGGVSPSYDNMRSALALRSKSGVSRLLTALNERGYITRLPNRARSIEILRMPDQAPLPKVSSVQSGNHCPHCNGIISIPFRGEVS